MDLPATPELLLDLEYLNPALDCMLQRALLWSPTGQGVQGSKGHALGTYLTPLLDPDRYQGPSSLLRLP